MLTIEQCHVGRHVERRVSGPNGASHSIHRGVVVKVLKKRVRVEWRSIKSRVSGSNPNPPFQEIGPFSTDVDPKELS
jgi:hypothetical protein